MIFYTSTLAEMTVQRTSPRCALIIVLNVFTTPSIRLNLLFSPRAENKLTVIFE